MRILERQSLAHAEHGFGELSRAGIFGRPHLFRARSVSDELRAK
jgi:hypothetical protein